MAEFEERGQDTQIAELGPVCPSPRGTEVSHVHEPDVGDVLISAWRGVHERSEPAKEHFALVIGVGGLPRHPEFAKIRLHSVRDLQIRSKILHIGGAKLVYICEKFRAGAAFQGWKLDDMLLDSAVVAGSAGSLA